MHVYGVGQGLQWPAGTQMQRMRVYAFLWRLYVSLYACTYLDV